MTQRNVGGGWLFLSVDLVPVTYTNISLGLLLPKVNPYCMLTTGEGGLFTWCCQGK